MSCRSSPWRPPATVRNEPRPGRPVRPRALLRARALAARPGRGARLAARRAMHDPARGRGAPAGARDRSAGADAAGTGARGRGTGAEMGAQVSTFAQMLLGALVVLAGVLAFWVACLRAALADRMRTHGG